MCVVVVRMVMTGLKQLTYCDRFSLGCAVRWCYSTLSRNAPSVAAAHGFRRRKDWLRIEN
ncbi:hypothetical protein SAMN05444158_3847 [Bradyrhizobium canariense]|uniref:Uncharacterized protein n=1 Tax=Bradyrhizobium canariense TaxID=255045 RepID=A0A1H1WGZ6_9BRAD|nr:hypothetical protein SAMN05444158_3847 [Bradyrhizobium canariense]